MLDLTRLQLLRTVIATGSLRASASTLGYTASAASQQLAALQRQTGLRLVERVGRGIAPTAAGRVLAAEANRVFEELSRLDGVVGDLRAGRVGSLSIGYVASVGATWLPPIVEVLRTEFPDLRLELRMSETNDGHCDVEIFIEDASMAPPPGVQVRPLITDPYVVAMRSDDPLAARPAVRLAELADRSWIDNEPTEGPCRRILLDACVRAGITPRFQVQTPDYRTALPMVTTGIGITALPRLAAVDLPAGVTTRPLTEPTPVRQVSMAVRASIAGNPAVRRTVGLFTSLAQRSERRADS
ncbi:LysR substrate-binding domain-containing protein [Nocardia sp. IFM 10818]